MTLGLVARGSAGACPDLDSLELVPLPPAVSAHVASCPQCKLVAEALSETARGDRVDEDECARFDALLAARTDGTINNAGRNLLERHLASCEACRAVAETISPTAETRGDLATLPSVDPQAYELGLEVARGGMGRILSARDRRVGRPVAVKELLDGASTGGKAGLAARFEREARVTARLQHPGIIPIYEIGRWPDGTPFYSMRMVEGHTLLAKIDKAKTLPSRLALLPTVIAACEAVAFAHGQRVIHRDLTPSNVLVGDYGETVVIDWGLAKDLAAETKDDDDELVGDLSASDNGLTGVGAVVGTPAYMPPEQAHAQPVDERADVYALGALLYHLLAGHAPYRGRTSRQVLAELKAGPPPPIDEVAPGSPRDLISIVKRAMARAPEDRYRDAREVAEELKRFQTGRMVEAHQYSRRELVRRFFVRNRAAMIVTLAATVVLVAFASASISRVVRSREEARGVARALLLEKGRLEWLGGDSLRALAYLYDAYQSGDRDATVDFLLGAALSDIAHSERVLDCGGDARYAVFSPDGKHVTVACHDLAKTWTLDDGTLVATYRPASGGAAGFDIVEYSLDGRWLLTAGSEGIVRMWDVASGKLVRELEHGATITFVRFTPDGTRLSTAGHDGLGHLWDATTGARLRTFDARDPGESLLDPIYRRLYGHLTPDGKRFVGVRFDGAGRGWDLETGAVLGGFEHGSLLAGGILSPDGKRALTCDLRGIAKVWDTETVPEDRSLERPPLRTLEAHSDVAWKCVFSPDSRLALTTSHDGTAKVWDVESGQLVTSVQHDDVVWIGNFAPDASRFATVGVGGRVKVWDARSGAQLAAHDTRNGKDAVFSPDGRRLVVLRGDQRVQIWGLPPSRRAAFNPAPKTRAIAVSPDGALIVTDLARAGEPGSSWSRPKDALELWHLHEGRRTHEPIELPLALGTGRVVAASPRVAAGGTELVVLDATGATRRRFVVEGTPVELELSADARRVLVTRQGADAELWDVETGTRIDRLAGHTRARLSQDGLRAIVWNDGEPAGVWDVETHRLAATLAVAGDHRPIGFAADGTRVVIVEHASEASHIVSLWDALTGTPILRLADTNGEPTIDPSGRWLTTIGIERILTVRDARDGSVLHAFPSDKAREAQANPDGTLVAAVDDYSRTLTILNDEGLVMAQWPLAHEPVEVTPEEIRPPNATVRWTPDGGQVVARSSQVAVWNIANRFTPDQIHAVIRQHMPYRIEDGRLVAVQNGRLAGRVVRGDTGVPGVRVDVTIRRVANFGTAINYKSRMAKVSTRRLVTDEDGEFELPNVPVGDYYLLTIDDGQTKRSVEVFVSVEDEPVTIELGP